MKVLVGQRPTSRPRSWQITDAVRQALDGQEVNRNYDVFEMDFDLYVQWGYRLTPALDSVVSKGKPFVILDGGFFEDRDQHFSVYFNGFQRMGFRCVTRMPCMARTDRPEIQDWRTGGKTIRIYGQVPTDRSLRDMNHDDYVSNARQDVAEAWPQYPVAYRPHPKSEKPHLHLPHMSSDYDDTFMGITFTSTAGVQLAVAGVPTMCYHPAAIAFPVASHDVSQRLCPEGRERWADLLTWFQYHDSEPEAAAEWIRIHYGAAREQAYRGDYDLTGIRP